MSAPDDEQEIRRQEARRWLAIVIEDIDVTRACMDLPHPRHGAAAYHLQQACEKLLKCLLVLAGQRLPKTHDLDDLASRVAPFHPRWASSFDTMRGLTVWGVAYRYPGIGDAPEPEPNRMELEDVATMIERLVAEVLPLTQDHMGTGNGAENG